MALRGTYQAGGYQNSGYQNTGYQGGPGTNGQPNGNYSVWQLPVQSGTLPIRKPTFLKMITVRLEITGLMERKRRKETWQAHESFVEKVIAVVVCGVFFGICAGVSFLAVNSLGTDKDTRQIAQTTGEAAQEQEMQAGAAEASPESGPR